MPKFSLHNAFKGRSGAYVGAECAGVPYFRRYRIPRDPRTPAQRTVRATFREITEIAQTINYGILRPYTFPRPRHLSPYNQMTKINAPLLNAEQWDPAALKILDGPLHNPGIATARIVLTPTRAAVFVTFDPRGGDPADIACLVVNDEYAGMTYYTTGTRRKGSLDIAIAPAGEPADYTQIYAYLCFAREPSDLPGGNPGENSATAFARATLADDPETRALANL
jgi:hypothetical protein